MNRLESDMYLGIDVGGTHTDLILAAGAQLNRSKAFTTHQDYSQGILDALAVVAQQLNVEVRDILSRCRMFVNGTTIVTNALAELRGAKVGVLITAGFKDTFRFAGGARRNDYDDHKQTNPPDVVPRECIEEIEERVDSAGNVLVPLNEAQVRSALRRLRAQEVEALAVCYLWSFKNQVNEQRTAEIIKEEFPQAFVTLSSEAYPIMRETSRWLTAVFNSFCYKATTRYLRTIEEKLRAAGFRGNLTFFQGIGGSITKELAEKFPIHLLASGPAGGVMGARYVAEKMGIKNILIGDMGGTSFDTSLIENLEVKIAKRVAFDELETGVNVVDVISVGAGGGSIAWIDSRGVPQVGPKSAGSEPGPSCYGRGGTEPTVTDAMVVMGFIDPTNYLGGRYKLDVEAAQRVISGNIGKQFGWSVEESAAGIHDLVVTNMANALREVSVERGYDPRDFAMFAYGGTLPLFSVQICRKLGIKQIVIPDNSSAFCAFGVLTADYVRQYDRTVEWVLANAEGYAGVNAVVKELMAQALEEAKQEGISEKDVRIVRSGDFRFMGQVYEVNVPLPDRDLTAADAAQLATDFPAIYERAYGKGTAWKGSPVVLLNYSLKIVGNREKPELRKAAVTRGDAAVAVKGQRSVYLPESRSRRTVNVYDEARLTPGMALHGPAIVDARDTTIYVPEGTACRRDEWYNFVLNAAD